MTKTKLDALKKRMDDLKAEMLTELKAVFKEAVKDIFEKYPAIENFSWTQYTPYFNDGDECTFSVHAYCCDINGEDQYSAPEGITEAMYEEVASVIASIDEDILKTMFGDHVKITATREDITIDEYSHD